MTALLLAHVMILRFLVLTQSISGSITNLDENTELVNSHYRENLCLTEEFPSVENNMSETESIRRSSGNYEISHYLVNNLKIINMFAIYHSLTAVSQAKILLLEISLSGGWQRPLHWLDWANTRDHDASGSLQNS